ncbi:cobaltochelatase subunit CobN [Ensifer soli]|uniref:cobaltochelatase subunit CobN n=1 Tax=Ciceribacter sp. sgz301302 TaxID=3342379 RepID=UPI0035BAE9D8
MHLLLAQRGSIADGDEAIDLGQSPGDVLFLSAADTELSSVAAARRGLEDAPTLRLANLLALKHPMSVDTYVERTVRHARLVVVRPLGGASYFQYLLEALYAAAVTHRFDIAVLPGCDKPDPGLDPYSTVSAAHRRRLWDYFTEGGVDNAGLFLRYCQALIGKGKMPVAARALLKAGIWWPGSGVVGVERWKALAAADEGSSPTVAVCFYRALVQSGETRPVEALVSALAREGLRALPVFVTSLKDAVSVATLQTIFSEVRPDLTLNATGFAVSAPGAARQPTVLETNDAPVLQVVFSGSSRPVWEASSQGLMARDLAMNVALPEVDGRILARAVSFKSAAVYDETVEANIVGHEPLADRIAFCARLAASWVRLRRTSPARRRVAIVLANYPGNDGRIGNGVGLDTPAGTVEVLRALAEAGYAVNDLPADGAGLIARLVESRDIGEALSLRRYNDFFRSLPDQIQREVVDRWGEPDADPAVRDGHFRLSLLSLGNVIVGIQPPRGRDVDIKETYHAGDLVPPHCYFAFYLFLRSVFGMDAIVHMGKHGTLEWLPGKALALSAACYPEAVLGPMPHLYPFIVNDPGEGTQAKRRSGAVIIDHLTPPLTRAGNHGLLADLESLVDEYYDAAGVDPRRLKLLGRQILDLVRDSGLDRDAGIAGTDAEDRALEKLDAYLCDLKEMQIRDGLHVFGVSPEGRLLTDLTVALARAPRGEDKESLHRAIAADAGLASGAAAFDPLDCAMAAPWEAPRPHMLAAMSDERWRTAGDTVDRIERMATALVSGEQACPPEWHRTKAVLDQVETVLKPSILACGPSERAMLLAGLDGRFVPPGPSGAPTRGRPDVLPTGRNFYSVDSRAVPTPAAYDLGRKSAELLIRRYLQDHGDWPRAFGLTAWGTSNMRSGGDDIAQAMALIGTKPVWDPVSHRVTGYEILPLAVLGRPRIDVTLRVSGFFRDAFPDQIALFDRAVGAVGMLDEDDDDNRVASAMRDARRRLQAAGVDAAEAQRQASYRVFGSAPGAYGAGLDALVAGGGWNDRSEIAGAYLAFGGHAYGAGEEGRGARHLLEERLAGLDAVVHNQDNREHDLLDSDGYVEFEGGMGAAVEMLAGARPSIYHNDHSRPERPVIRTLEEEIGRVVRGRAVNPKWIAGVMRHGYKGAIEIAATVDYLYAFAAVTGAVGDHHFDAVYAAYVNDEAVRRFLQEVNPAALSDMADTLLDAIARGLWTPRSNSARFELEIHSARAAHSPRGLRTAQGDTA